MQHNMKWELHDLTKSAGGYLQLTCDGKRVCDFFPFAKGGADEQWVREQAKMVLNAMNDDAPPIREALEQLIGWVEECGSDHEGRQYALTEARAALRGIRVATAV